jgi:pimeloyl-ACP methyl ester carboxylesterase
MANIQFELASGRKLGVTVFGNPYAPRLVVFCHPAPGASTFDPDPDASVRRDVQIVAIDRPGYGSSDPLPPGKWPSVAGAASDIAEYLRASQITASPHGNTEFGSVGVVGWSAGGRVALALAAAHPEIVDRVAVVATPAPNSEVQWIDPALAATTERLATGGPDAAIEGFVEMFTERMADQLPSHHREGPVPLDMLGATPADAPALAYPGARDRLDLMLRGAFRQGPRGLAADVLSYTVRDWGFELDDIRAKTLLLYGAEDAVIGREHASWYRDHIVDARVELAPGAGHLLVIPKWDSILAFLTAE